MPVIKETKKLAAGALQVKDVMTTEVHSVSASSTIEDIVKLFLSHNISGAPIIDANRKVVSVVSQSDLIQFIAMGGLQKRIGDFSKKLPEPNDLICVKTSDPFKEVFKLFLTKPVRRIIVTDGTGHLQGIVSKSNLLKAFMVTEGLLDQ